MGVQAWSAAARCQPDARTDFEVGLVLQDELSNLLAVGDKEQRLLQLGTHCSPDRDAASFSHETMLRITIAVLQMVRFRDPLRGSFSSVSTPNFAIFNFSFCRVGEDLQ